jgi:hypothetical protein
LYPDRMIVITSSCSPIFHFKVFSPIVSPHCYPSRIINLY